jgi:pimeloyl-ACP methyl ester carboxylesterase
MRALVLLTLLGVALWSVPSARNSSEPQAQTTSAKYTYVLVHGAWAGGWEWKKVGQELLSHGHTVYRPTHTGQGERVHLTNPDISLDTHITDIVNVIRFEDLRDVVLMGHSYGGMVISGVADNVPERIKCLIYVDAFLPENGESLNAMTGRERPASNGFVGNAPKPDQQPPYTVPQSARTFSQAISLTNPAARRLPAAYILTVDKGRKPEEDTFFKSYQRAQARGWFADIMEGGHVVNQTHPAELAQLLEAAPAKAKPSPQ